MTATCWRQLKNLYAQAEDVDDNERETLLAGSDPELADIFRNLLAAGRSEGFLDRPLHLTHDTTSPHAHTFSPGDCLCERFNIVRFIARGGMGEVYEAYDSELREAVALKTLRAGDLDEVRSAQSFRREVRRARAISSQHVCRVHDVFTHRPGEGAPPVSFFSMHLLDGETLAARIKREGKLKPADALWLLQQLAEGIDAAHREGIVHGDFKSANVMLTPDRGGRISACITDFGLARRIASNTDNSETVTDSMPRGGTPAWMAPEQVEGRPPGPEADIYAFGLVAYEMTTGRLPFDGETPAEVAHRRLSEAPQPARHFAPELKPSWERAFMRCLDRDPAKRFPTAAAFVDAVESGQTLPRKPALWLAVAAALVLCFALVVTPLPGRRWLAAVLRPVARDRSVAVLPFKKLGPTPDYFSDGFTEELINGLSRVRGLRVLGPESSFYFKSSELLPADIGRKLGVRYLLTGSVRRMNQEIRVIARLIDAADGSQIWSGEVVRNESDLFLIRDDIIRAASGELHVSLAGVDSPSQTIEASGLNARDLYWTGRLYFRQRTEEGVRASLDYFHQAVARDPSFALGYCGLADALFVAAERYMLPSDQALAEAGRAARKAGQLDSQLPDAWLSLAYYTSVYERDLDSADRYFHRALALDPKSAAALQWYSLQLLKQRRFAESIAAAEEAVAIDPLSGAANFNLAVAYLYSGADDRAVQQSRKLSLMEPQLFSVHPLVALVFARKGLLGEALHEMELVPESGRDYPLTLRMWVEIYGVAHKSDDASRALNRLLARYREGGVPISYVAIAYAAAGDKEHAIEWLSRAVASRDTFASEANVYPAFDSIRSDPRFVALVARLGINPGNPAGSSAPH
jgi:TolB-like protein/tetratricopeptide (TPR) repeat protein/tRNA A-37 threonylcarbamoyl transferase component Bud32